MSVSLAHAIEALERIAPPALAESWDNVGLLVRPTRPRRIDRIWLTIDLTAEVMREAVAGKAQMIVAYHPAVFGAVKRTDELKPAALEAIERRIAIYSPHTALDAAPGGMCDWLADGLGELSACEPITTAQAGGSDLKLVIFTPAESVDALRIALAKIGAGQIGAYSQCSYELTGQGTFLGDETSRPVVGRRGKLERVDEVRLEMVCPRAKLAAAAMVIARVHPYEEPAWDVYPLATKPRADAGPGRIATLSQPASLNTLIGRIKSHLQLKHVRVARPAKMDRISQVAVCPGAGGSLFADLDAPQLYLTGEMRHHDLLDKVEQGAAVVLTDHTNTERGYLPTLRKRLIKELGKGVAIHIASSDHDPLKIA
jgi:dinuclear metal center YbgI/SA1388 family protein